MIRRYVEKFLPVGTRSLLYGAHQFLLHPPIVAFSWWMLYGWEPVGEPGTDFVVRLADPRLWIAFVIHDWGYWGRPNMDGAEGELHPEWAARVMRRLFGRQWHDECLLHSRFYSKALDRPFSRLCVADKLAIALTPTWLYVPMVRWTGEILEYRKGLRGRTQARVASKGWEHPTEEETDESWHARVQDYCLRWAFVHRYASVDTWTAVPASREVTPA